MTFIEPKLKSRIEALKGEGVHQKEIATRANYHPKTSEKAGK